MISLQEAIDTYPAALYVYFRISNLGSEYQKILSDSKYTPQFSYRDSLTLESVDRRIVELQEDIAETKTKPVVDFLERRLKENQLLKLFLLAHDNSALASKDLKTQYHALQVDLYGSIDTDLFKGIVGFVTDISQTRGNDTGIFSAMAVASDEQVQTRLYTPQAETFTDCREAFAQAFPAVLTALDSIDETMLADHGQIVAVFKAALDAIDATAHGWSVTSGNYGGNVYVAKSKKRIIIPKQLTFHSVKRFMQVVVHEVVGHIYPSLYRSTSDVYDSELEEGLAIVLEQLLHERFMHRRTMRYLAICLALGVDGTPRAFNEVFNMLTEAFQALGHSSDQARQRAFSETTRAFRGGIPAEPGMAYVKDKIYLEGNVRVWKYLDAQNIDAEQFKNILRNYATMQSGSK